MRVFLTILSVAIVLGYVIAQVLRAFASQLSNY